MAMQMRHEDPDDRAGERARDDVGREVLAGADALDADERLERRQRR